MVADGRFREDLFYRINVIPIHLPPLRERGEDIPLLAEYFLAKYRDQMGKDIHGLSQETMDLLDAYEWPGNIRELENVIERAVALEKSQTILPESLPEHIAQARAEGAGGGGSASRVGLQSRGARRRAREGIHHAGAGPRRRRAGEGGRAARDDLPLVPLLRQEIQLEMRRLPARGDRPMAFALLALSLVYLWFFVPRGWIPHDEGMLGQSAERVLAGGLPHIDYEEPYTGGLTWMHAAVFKLAGIDLDVSAVAAVCRSGGRAGARLSHPQALSGTRRCRHWCMGGARLEFPQLFRGATVVVAARLRAGVLMGVRAICGHRAVRSTRPLPDLRPVFPSSSSRQGYTCWSRSSWRWSMRRQR